MLYEDITGSLSTSVKCTAVDQISDLRESSNGHKHCIIMAV